MLHHSTADSGEVKGLLALMLLIDARWRARVGRDGALIPLDEQDRRLWDRATIAEGVALVSTALSRGPPGPYQLHAAIAAVRAEAARAKDTDWPQILTLYQLLDHMTSNPMIALNHAVAAAMVHGPDAGLDRLAALDDDPRLANHHRLSAVRAHLLEMAGFPLQAYASYRAAARGTTSLAERRYLEDKAARLAASADADGKSTPAASFG